MCEERSARLMVTPGEKVAVELGRVRTEMLNLGWVRSRVVMGVPIVPLA